MIEPMIAWARASRPPTPRPWRLRAASSCGTSCAKPAASEPSRNRTPEIWTSSFLSNRSASFDQLGLETVIAKIGRASCRERVCQYVWISVVAVTLKKKHHHHPPHTSPPDPHPPPTPH